MPPPRLIVIEGLPGTGKSTVAQRIAIDGARLGLAAQWYYEEQRGHPLHGYFDPATDGTPDRFMDAAVARWRSFARDAGPGMQVVESHLMQGPIGTLLLHGVDPETIPPFVERLMRAADPLHPRLVFLRDADPDSALRRITTFRWGTVEDSPYVRRCDASPFAMARGIRGMSGLITFQRAWSLLADACLARCGWPVLTVTGDLGDAAAHADRYRTICEFLGLGPLPPAAACDSRPYAGIYVPGTGAPAGNAATAGARFTIAGDGDGLLVRGCPRLWRSGNRLLPRSLDRFHVVSWPLEAVFAMGPDGRAATMRLVSPDGMEPDLISTRIADGG